MAIKKEMANKKKKKYAAIKRKVATNIRYKNSSKKNKIKKKQKRGKKMSTETVKGGVSSSLDTSHLKVPFPFKSKYGNYIGGKFVEPKSGNYFDNVSPINNEVI